MADPQAQGAFPPLALPDIEGVERSLAELWREGPALVIVGHRDCKTTRQTLPHVDRIYRRRAAGSAALAVLQDDAETARELCASLGLELPVRLDADPYRLAQALGLATVPTLFLVGHDGALEAVSEGFVRADLEAFAARLGVTPPLFAPDEKVPALRPG
jgi:hypothetical protein